MATLQLLAQELTREGARDAARAELGRPEYAEAQPPLVLRVVGRVLRELGELLDGATGFGDGTAARIGLALVLVGAVVVVLLRLGPLARPGRAGGAVFDGGPVRTAGDHRTAAEALAGEGRWAEAVRERLRAVVRELEVRGVLDARPGRTAGEVARDAGSAVPVLAPDLARAAGLFDEVWYGGRPGTAATYASLVEVDDRVRAARLVPA
jgi:hypothetical protein